MTIRNWHQVFLGFPFPNSKEEKKFDKHIIGGRGSGELRCYHGENFTEVLVRENTEPVSRDHQYSFLCGGDQIGTRDVPPPSTSNEGGLSAYRESGSVGG